MIQPYPFSNFHNFRRNPYYTGFHNSVNSNLSKSSNPYFPKSPYSHTSDFQNKQSTDSLREKKVVKEEPCNSSNKEKRTDEKPIFEIFRSTPV